LRVYSLDSTVTQDVAKDNSQLKWRASVTYKCDMRRAGGGQSLVTAVVSDQLRLSS